MTPKVYTHYTRLTDGEIPIGIRWRTILQFGDAWDVKGTVVMKNPGESGFKHSDKQAITDGELLRQLTAFDDGELHKASWYEFTADATMMCVTELFEEYYALRQQKLNGVIQIFNLFYLRDPNLSQAIKKAECHDLADMSEYDLSHMVAPVYLGFAALANHKCHGATAEKFFRKAQELGMRNLNDEFLKNDFIHPLYLMRFGKNTPKCQAARTAFLNNTL